MNHRFEQSVGRQRDWIGRFARGSCRQRGIRTRLAFLRDRAAVLEQPLFDPFANHRDLVVGQLGLAQRHERLDAMRDHEEQFRRIGIAGIDDFAGA